MDLEKFQAVVFHECGLNENSTAIVGVSGGPDSIALLDLMQRSGIPVIAAHFNHQLREDAEKDELFVRDLSKKRKIRFVSERKNIIVLAKKNKRSIEEQARISRYKFLFETAKKYQATFVAVGHNTDDQVETVLMHLIRGSGLAGLCGMSIREDQTEWGKGIVLIRPLLSFWRSEIVEYCRSRGLEPVYDLSNNESIYHRNRIRHELIPFLNSYNPQIKKRIVDMAEVLKGEKEIISEAVQATWNQAVIKDEQHLIVMKIPNYLMGSKGMQRGLLRRSIYKLLPDQRDVDFLTIERARDFICTGRDGCIELIKDLILEREGEYVIISKAGWGERFEKYPQIDKSIKISKKEAEIPLNEHWSLKITNEIASDNQPIKRTNSYQANIDADKVIYPIVVRTQAPGDRFQPLGLDGHSLKLSDFWINRKLPRKYRDHYPLVCDRSAIIWIPGFQPSENVKNTASTKRLLHLLITKKTDRE
jgi:tRNA(Ile)-lysidine synthase